MLRKKGFTLIEILFVVAVIAILAAVVTPRLLRTADEARGAACDANMANINTQIERYYFEEGSWPSQDLDEMTPPDSYDYFPDGLPNCPVAEHAGTGGTYEMNMTTHRVYEGANHDHTP